MSHSIPIRFEELVEVFGRAVVFLKCNGKKPIKKGWQKLTVADMTASYLRSLRGLNIGIVLGRPSEGLCCVDLDEDDAVEWFLRKNPRLRGSCRIKGRRGEKIFIRIEGPFPRKHSLTREGIRVGDFLSTGAQAVVAGIHPDTKQSYYFTHKASPPLLRFEDIDFDAADQKSHTPKNITWPVHTDTTECTESTASLHPLRILHNIETEKQLSQELEQIDPRLPQIYDHFVDRIYLARAGERNSTMIKAVDFLFRAFSRQIVIVFMDYWYRFNALVFSTSHDTHMKEVNSALKGSLEKYLRTLGPVEGKIYASLSDLEQDVFRIVRDLASVSGTLPIGQFFLSCDQLAKRLGNQSMQALRLLHRFESRYGLIRTVKKGKRRRIGEKGEATIYQWLLRLPERPPAALGSK